MGLRRLLTMRGARAIADTLPPVPEIERLWREADEAAERLQVALESAPDGCDLRELPEYKDWRPKASAFTEAAERMAGLRA